MQLAWKNTHKTPLTSADVGWDAKPGEGHLDAILRSVVVGQHGGYGDPGTLKEARKRFDALDDGLRDAVAPIRMQLTRIGRNLNQAMKAGNAAMMADSGLQIDRELRRIADMREEINEQIEVASNRLAGDAQPLGEGCSVQ